MDRNVCEKRRERDRQTDRQIERGRREGGGRKGKRVKERGSCNLCAYSEVQVISFPNMKKSHYKVLKMSVSSCYKKLTTLYAECFRVVF